MSPTPMSFHAARETIALRRAGMTIPDIVIALQHFHGERVTYHQVHGLTRKIGLERGLRPAHALCHKGVA